MHLQFEITKEDYAAFAKLHFRKRLLWPLLIIEALIFVLIFILGFDDEDHTSMIVSMVVFFLLYLVPVLLFFFRSMKVPKNSHILGSKEMDFTDDQVTCKTPAASSMVDWSRITRIQKRPDAYYLYLGLRSAFIIPWRAFKNDTERLEFEKLALSKIA